MAERESRGSKEAELRVRKEGNSVVRRMSRQSAEERAEELAAEGWEAEVLEVEPEAGEFGSRLGTSIT